MALIDGLAAYLVEQLPLVPDQILGSTPLGSGGAGGLVLGVNLFLSGEPTNAPDACIIIANGVMAGRGPSQTMGPGPVGVEYPRIQCKVRGEQHDYPTTAALAKAVMYVFTIGTACWMGGEYLLNLQPLATPIQQPEDVDIRPVYLVNLEATVQSYYTQPS